VRRTIIWAAAVTLAAALAACGSAPDATVQAATLKACKALQAWYASDPTGFFAGSAASAAVQLDAKNTPLGTVLSAWVDDMQSDAWHQSSQDSDKVFADCGNVGVPILSND
jgi:hypothetical protein